MATRTESIEAVRARLVDPGRGGGAKTMELADIGLALDSAVARYSKDKPRKLIVSFSGSGARYYSVASYLPGWIRGFSEIVAVEYPAVSISDDEEPQWLDPRDWEIYSSATDTEYLYFPIHTPGTTETVRVVFTARHTHTDDSDTVYEQDLEAVRDLAASIACEMLATRASGFGSSGIAADSVNYRDSQLRYSQQAKAWLEKYKRHMGIPVDGSAKAAGIVLEYPSERSRRESYLMH